MFAPGLAPTLSDGSPRRPTQNQSRSTSYNRAFKRSESWDGKMGRRDDSKFHHVRGCARITATSQRSTASDFAGIGHGARDFQGIGRGEARWLASMPDAVPVLLKFLFALQADNIERYESVRRYHRGTVASGTPLVLRWFPRLMRPAPCAAFV